LAKIATNYIAPYSSFPYFGNALARGSLCSPRRFTPPLRGSVSILNELWRFSRTILRSVTAAPLGESRIDRDPREILRFLEERRIGGRFEDSLALVPTTDHVRVRHVTLFPPSSLPAVVARARSDSLMHGFLCGNASPHYSTLLLRARPTLHPSRSRSLLYFCHENGPRPSSPPATSITDSSSPPRHKTPRSRGSLDPSDYRFIDIRLSSRRGKHFFPTDSSRSIFMHVQCCQRGAVTVAGRDYNTLAEGSSRISLERNTISINDTGSVTSLFQRRYVGARDSRSAIVVRSRQERERETIAKETGAGVTEEEWERKKVGKREGAAHKATARTLFSHALALSRRIESTSDILRRLVGDVARTSSGLLARTAILTAFVRREACRGG